LNDRDTDSKGYASLSEWIKGVSLGEMMRISRPYLLLLVGYAFLLLVITVSASLDADLWVMTVASDIPFGDKLGHLALSGVLSFLLNKTLRCRTVAFRRVDVRIGSLLAYLLVLAEELSQIWIISRRAEALDLLCAFAGIHIFGMLATYSQQRSTQVRST